MTTEIDVIGEKARTPFLNKGKVKFLSNKTRHHKTKT